MSLVPILTASIEREALKRSPVVRGQKPEDPEALLADAEKIHELLSDALDRARLLELQADGTDLRRLAFMGLTRVSDARAVFGDLIVPVIKSMED